MAHLKNIKGGIPLDRINFIMKKNKPKILFIQPKYAHYRHDLFSILDEDLDITFVFMNNSKTEYNYPSNTTIDPNWRIVNMDGFKNKLRAINLFFLIMKLKPDAVVSSINGSPQSIIAAFTKIIFKFHFILWSESWGAPYRALSEPFWKTKLKNRRSKWVTMKASAIVVGGSRSEEYHKNMGIPSMKIFKAYQSIKDIKQFIPKYLSQKQSFKSNEFIILYFSRIVESKGLEVLINAQSKLERSNMNSKLLICGDGPYREHCEKLAKKLQLNNVSFIGSVINEDSWIYYKSADTFVLPCNGKGRGEGWGLVLNEAASMSLPIITTKAVGGVEDIVVNNKNGFVISPNNINELTNALIKLINNKPLKESMGSESRKIFEAINNYKEMANGFKNAISYAMKNEK